MNSRLTEEFVALFARLPESVKNQARIIGAVQTLSVTSSPSRFTFPTTR
jgi:hypothetical protein